MQRRKFLVGMGSLAAGGAAAVGSSAFSLVSAGRSVQVNVAGDRSAYLGFDPSISEYASLNSSDQLTLQFNGANDQVGEGLNDNANSLFQNIFKIENNATDTISIVCTGFDTSTDDGDGVDPLTIYWTNDEVNEESPAYGEMNAMNGSPNPLGDESYGTESSLAVLDSGESISIHTEFYLSDSDTLSDVEASPDAIPEEINFYAQGYNRE